MTDKVLLCSFPKSGSNWVRDCIEYFSGRPTPGSERKLLVHGGDPIIDRTHFRDKADRALLRAYGAHSCAQAVRPEPHAPRRWLKRLKRAMRIRASVHTRRVLLLVRNPFDLYVRVQASRPEALSGFASNIAIFDRCRRDKLLVYYEDVVSKTEEIARILDFLGIPYDLTRFDLEAHRQRSLALYAQGPNLPQTADNPLDFGRRARRLDPARRAALRQFLHARLGSALDARSLARYEAPLQASESAQP